MELSDRRVCVVCRPSLAPGFALAGARVTVSDEASVGRELARLGEDASVGIVLVEDRLRRAIPESLARRLRVRPVPVVTFFPSPDLSGVSSAEDEVLEILRQAVGYRVRPR
jgi:vacuolar-type H+-ATPase subunit F/Vma7